MLLMLEKPRPTLPERAGTAAIRTALTALTLVDAVILWPFRRAEQKRIVEALAAMSDHDLRDIGLQRHDLRDSMALPASRDVGSFLADRRAERRHRG